LLRVQQFHTSQSGSVRLVDQAAQHRQLVVGGLKVQVAAHYELEVVVLVGGRVP
jgi:hypothetical protein